MTLLERLDAVCDRWNVLRHPFYRRWEAGDLSRDDLAYYAGEYRHAVVALAGLAAASSDAEHASEEAAHVALWDDFAAALGTDLKRRPRAETDECVRAWSGEGLQGVAALYAIESGQPEISRTKLDGLVQHYGFARETPATAYFELHAERDQEHAAQSRAVLAQASDADEDELVAAAEKALCGNWMLLDGVEGRTDGTAA